MFSPSLADLVFKATHLAEQSRASEISIDILLAALDAPEIDPASLFGHPADSGSGGYFVNTAWLPLSAAAAKVIAPFAEMQAFDRHALRSALLEASER